MNLTTTRIAVSLMLVAASGVASAACVPVIGTVKLVPDSACTIRSVAQPGTSSLFGTECFSVTLALAGFPVATGYAGTTYEPLVSLVPGAPATVAPVAIPDASGSPVPRQLIQTARTSMVLGNGSRRTTIYSTDVVVIQPQLSATGTLEPKMTTEQILLSGTNGQGAYAGVTGYLTVLGSTVGKPSPVAGQICMP